MSATTVLALVLAACSDDSTTTPVTAPSPSSGTSVLAPARSPAPIPQGPVVHTFNSAGTRFQVTQVARGLDTVWALDWDSSGALWYTERGGRLTRLAGQPQTIGGVEEEGEGGLMGLEIDAQDRKYLMYTSGEDNRVVRLEADGSQRVLARGIQKTIFHNGGRLRFSGDGVLHASTGDALMPATASDPQSRNGKILQIDPESGRTTVLSRGHRNVQGLCLAPDGRLLATEHGPSGGDEVNAITPGFNGGWPGRSGNGIRNYTPSVAPAGCAVYDAQLIPAWRGSMLFATLRGTSLRRLTFNGDGSVAGEEVLLDGVFGRLRDAAVGPDGGVYLATSNRDGRGQPREGDDRILRISPAP